MWGQDIEPNCRSCLKPKGSIELHAHLDKWPLVTSLSCLGFLIQDNAETDEAWLAARKAMWRAFMANCSDNSHKAVSMMSKLKLLSKAVLPGLRYRSVIMPLIDTRMKQIDKEQRKMVTAIMRVPMMPHEDIESFCRRRNRLASAQIAKSSKWSLAAGKIALT